MGGEGRASVHDTTYDPLVEQNRCQVGPTILFECPAQIPRSSLRSFTLWARHSAETSAELNVRSGAAEFFPVASRQVRGGGSGGGEEMAGRARGRARVEGPVHGTKPRALRAYEPCAAGATNHLRCTGQTPPA